jgi:SAM-dependent methyltransferase
MVNEPEPSALERAARVIFKSEPLTGIMAEEYFEIATPRHFWCRRRFEVLQELADARLRSVTRVAEIGCGNGVLQRQLEDTYLFAPSGFDLHEAALRKNICRRAGVYCYDINDRAEEFRKAFDVLLLFDVLEHIEDQDRFLESVKFHLADGGCIIINVPALQWLFSPYDRVQGHQRRYSLASLLEVGKRNGLRAIKSTYWGGPLVPILALRKATLTIRKARTDNYSTGFDPRGDFMNTGLYHLSRCELLPQRIAGTSVMAVFATEG